MELPPELEEPIKSTLSNSQTDKIFNVNYKPIDDVPYGCLKNGNKKTYREWKEFENPINIIRPPTPPKQTVGLCLAGTEVEEQEVSKTLSREDRLENIKNKLRKMEDKETYTRQTTIDNLIHMEKEMNKNKNISLVELSNLDDCNNKDYGTNIEEMLQDKYKDKDKDKDKECPKTYVKKTIKRNFTLGRSAKLRHIAVLIKDKQTRKKIINTQKELKKTNITDVRKYLRQHGIIKIGSLCPADILRKTFESAVMAGEVTNTNKETLLHNFLNEDQST